MVSDFMVSDFMLPDLPVSDFESVVLGLALVPGLALGLVELPELLEPVALSASDVEGLADGLDTLLPAPGALSALSALLADEGLAEGDDALLLPLPLDCANAVVATIAAATVRVSAVFH
jgi:hypothetical protein